MEFLRLVRVAVEQAGHSMKKFASGNAEVIHVGWDGDALHEPENAEISKAVQLVNQYAWSAERRAITSLLFTYNLQVMDSGERANTSFVAWEATTHHMASYVILTGRTRSERQFCDMHTLSMIPVTGEVEFEKQVVGVFLMTDEEPETDRDRELLISWGFPLKASLKTSALDQAMSSLGIERKRYHELVRVGKDTRGVSALLWWFTSGFLDYTTVEAERPSATASALDQEVGPEEARQPGPVFELTSEEEDEDVYIARPRVVDWEGMADVVAEADLDVVRDENIFEMIVDGKCRKLHKNELQKISVETGVSMGDLQAAWASLPEHRFFYGVLQRYTYNRQTGLHEWYTLVPEGGWKSVMYQGERRRYSLRRYVILLFHDAPLGGHRDRDRTRDAILDAGLMWKNLRLDVEYHIRGCLKCKWAKGRPLVTGLQRSREAEGPFRVLTMDFVGPQYPATPRGHVYLFTCACVFSGWYWAVPCSKDDSVTAAEMFAERVMLDLAGVPTMLCSDRAKAFTDGVVKQLNERFGIRQVLGSALHPQSQSAVERPHREYKAMAKQFMTEFKNRWDMIAPLFQWSVRTSCKVYNGCYTPYEIVTGMKPRLPLDSLVTPAVLKKQPVDDYVGDLITYLKKVHAHVQTEHKRVRENEQDVILRRMGVGQCLDVGDYVLLKGHQGAEKGVSQRFQHNTDTRLFQVHSVTGGDPLKAKTVTLMDPTTGSTSFDFAQPISIARLVPAEVLPLTRCDDKKTRFRSQERTGTIEATCVDGRVHVKWDDNALVQVVDLSRMPHEFIA